MFKTFKELEDKIGELDKSLGLCKVRLIHEDGGGEGIWAVPLDPGSKAKLESDSSKGEYAYVRLCNTPLGWNNLTWGGLVRVKTSGELRAVGNLDEQDLPDLKADRDNLTTLVNAELAARGQTDAN